MKLSKSQQSQLDERIKLNMDRENEKIYANQEKQRFSIEKEKKSVLTCGILTLILFILSFLFVGSILNGNFSIAWMGHYTLRRVNDLVDLITGNHMQSGMSFFLCSLICPVFVGAALAASGACFQSIFHNPMASPTMLGVEAGGQFGNLIYLLFFSTTTMAQVFQFSYEGYAAEYHAMSLWDRYGQFAFTFAGCVLVVLFVMLMTKLTGKGKISTVPLLLGGTVFVTIVNSIITAVQYYQNYFGNNSALAEQMNELQSGSFSNIETPFLLLCFLIPVVIPMIILMFFTGKLNIIAFGEEEARLMGIDVSRYRNIILLLSTLMTASVVAFCGSIGFIGLMVPHIARYIVGSDSRYLVPASAFLGAIFMLGAYDLSYMVNFLINPGVIINTIGGVVFTTMMIIYRRRANADWA